MAGDEERRLVLAPLTREAFAPFGEVVDAASACERYPINDGLTQRHHDLGRVDCDAGGGVAALSLFRAQPVDDSFRLRSMERHPLASQAFINIAAARYAVVVAPPGELHEDAIKGFLAAPGQSVNYLRGTWHHFLLVLDAPADFVVVDRVGPGRNCDEQALRTPLRLVLPS
ncbi:MAG: ureidoglycolate lyase [Halieaceae bacterium]|jgi:ureidoglycolate lyase|nr:ureidoglycolate lyase [Halieaceae bacterium]